MLVLKTPEIQVVLYGYTGSGKTTLEYVVKHSSGVAAIYHHLGLLICESIDIEKTDLIESKSLLDYDDFNYAVNEYIKQESDSLKSSF